MSNELDRYPTNEEHRRRLDWRHSKFNDIVRHRSSAVQPISLDEPISEDEPGETQLDFLRSPEDVSRLAQLSAVRAVLEKEMDARLTPSEKRVLILTHGLFGEDKLSMQKVGNMFSVTRAHQPNSKICKEETQAKLPAGQLVQLNVSVSKSLAR